MQVSVETITPEIAEQLLAKNTHNRNLNQARVKKFADAMARGEWILNGESIKLGGTNGEEVLLDGQTRSAAVIRSGVSIESIVVRGLPLAAQETVDLGQARRLGHILQLRGERNAQALAAAITGYFRYVNGYARSGFHGYPTPQQGIALLEKHPGLRDSARFGHVLNDHFRVPPTVGAWTSYEFSRLDSEDAEVFFQKLLNGAELEEGSAILALRRVLERWLTERAESKRRGSTNQVDYAAHIIKAWNYWRRGAYVKSLRWYKGGSRQEDFPTAE